MGTRRPAPQSSPDPQPPSPTSQGTAGAARDSLAATRFLPKKARMQLHAPQEHLDPIPSMNGSWPRPPMIQERGRERAGEAVQRSGETGRSTAPRPCVGRPLLLPRGLLADAAGRLSWAGTCVPDHQATSRVVTQAPVSEARKKPPDALYFEKSLSTPSSLGICIVISISQRWRLPSSVPGVT